MATYQITTDSGAVYEITTEEPSNSLEQSSKLSLPGYTSAQGRGARILDSVLFGFGDEAQAAYDALKDTIKGDTRTGKSFAERFKNYQTVYDATNERFKEENPVESVAIDVFTPNPLSKIKTIKNAGLAGRVLNNVLQGASTGAIVGAGSNEEDRLQGALSGGALGAGFGGVLGAVGEGIGAGSRYLKNLFTSTDTIGEKRAQDILRQVAGDRIEALAHSKLPLTLAEELQDPTLARMQIGVSKIESSDIPKLKLEAKQQAVNEALDIVAPQRADDILPVRLREELAAREAVDADAVEQMYKAISADSKVEMPKLSTINKIINKYIGETGEPDSKIKAVIGRINQARKNPTFHEWQAIRVQLNDAIGDLDKAQQRIALGIKDELNEAAETSFKKGLITPQDYQTWKTANQMAKDKITTYEKAPSGKLSNVGKLLKSKGDEFALEDSRIIEAAYDGKPETAMALLKAVGPENKDMVRSVVVQRWADRLQEPEIAPGRWVKILDTEAQRLKKLFTKPQLKAIEEARKTLVTMQTGRVRGEFQPIEVLAEFGGSQTKPLEYVERLTKRFARPKAGAIGSAWNFVIEQIAARGQNVDMATNRALLAALYDPKIAKELMGKYKPGITDALIDTISLIDVKSGIIKGVASYEDKAPKFTPLYSSSVKPPPAQLLEPLYTEKKTNEPILMDQEPMTKDFENNKKDVRALIDEQPPLIRAVIGQESAGKFDAISKAGAQGLMQLMPATGREVFQNLKLKGLLPGYQEYDPYDPELNVILGTEYLNQMMNKFGDVQLALAAYNAGPGRISRLMKEYGDSFEAIRPYLPDETRKYVPSILKRLNKIGFINV